MKALIDVLRAGGVVRYSKSKDGSVEVVLGPPPAKAPAAKQDSDPLATRRAYYERMLDRPIGDQELGLLP